LTESLQSSRGFPALAGRRALARLKPAIGNVDKVPMIVTNSQFDLLARLMDVADLRHEVIAQNVANVNTPGYRRQDVQFEDAFAKALLAGQNDAALQAKPQVTTAPGGIARADGNNVDIDQEISRLEKNSLLYKVYTQILAVQVNQMRSAISGR
jgi:flagellar basal-body rod protein FlgB